MFYFKQSIVIRDDIKMSRGKIAAQAAHAAVTATELARKTRPEWYEKWLEEGQKKVVLKVSSEKELLELYEKAKKKNLPAVIIRDMGLTEIPPRTITAIAIGPAPEKLVDDVTGHLPLLK
ncbi:MAG: peptidyl-tRNA hydrolase [Thermoprotei archaeon]|nr:MAG: peptidyl-tRNA hydrolase [Thermoprotei archaeon]